MRSSSTRWAWARLTMLAVDTLRTRRALAHVTGSFAGHRLAAVLPAP
jgi:hypothetical protein